MPRGQKSSGYTYDGNSLERLANSSVPHQARYPLMWGRPYTEAAGGSRGNGIGLGGQTRCRPSDEVKSLMNLEGRFRGQYKHPLYLGAFLHYKKATIVGLPRSCGQRVHHSSEIHRGPLPREPTPPAEEQTHRSRNRILLVVQSEMGYF